jgi:hypothetical protein
MWMWIRNTFSDTLRFPSLGLVSVFKNTTEYEHKLPMGCWGSEKVTSGTSELGNFR